VESDSPSTWRGPVPYAVYAAMFGGAILGQIVGIAFDKIVFDRHVVAVPIALSAVLESLIGARFARYKLGHVLSGSERWRLALWYTLALAGFTAPIVGWMLFQRFAGPGAHAAPSGGTVALVVVAIVAGLGALALLHYLLITLFSPKR
jgi:hypothetical protein